MQDLSKNQRKVIEVAVELAETAEWLRLEFLKFKLPDLQKEASHLGEKAIQLRNNTIRKAGEQIIKKEIGLE